MSAANKNKNNGPERHHHCEGQARRRSGGRQAYVQEADDFPPNTNLEDARDPMRQVMRSDFPRGKKRTPAYDGALDGGCAATVPNVEPSCGRWIEAVLAIIPSRNIRKDRFEGDGRPAAAQAGSGAQGLPMRWSTTLRQLDDSDDLKEMVHGNLIGPGGFDIPSGVGNATPPDRPSVR